MGARSMPLRQRWQPGTIRAPTRTRFLSDISESRTRGFVRKLQPLAYRSERRRTNWEVMPVLRGTRRLPATQSAQAQSAQATRRQALASHVTLPHRHRHDGRFQPVPKDDAIGAGDKDPLELAAIRSIRPFTPAQGAIERIHSPAIELRLHHDTTTR